MLCPNTAIGSIIGRGGSVISQLNQKTGAKIKLSQNQDFFPMTNDRVIAISGEQECIAVAVGELITKIIEVSPFHVTADFLSQNNLVGFNPMKWEQVLKPHVFCK